ncbi:spermatogenesis-associated protein 6 isoform X2 [Plutella xylostella]|uniref:spermatogenesis-associated protein 6 isoform X2 n=1 Tax=Plutella xylostella TaxID=51655 RepID=UPI0020323DA9|nr:spermatogenesis-associated protein 6 isoform X2 [Plutella xylostella]
MPKIVELTVELHVQRVSCPGVWLCQDGRVSLTVAMLGTSYQTSQLPPCFPLQFKDVFYFRKRFRDSCSLSNVCCMMKDETIYCELIQWCQEYDSGSCKILAQYLGALNDVLFPSNNCCSDGLDLLMRRSKDFPGILSPKIEVTTKMRMDEVWVDPGAPDLRQPVLQECYYSVTPERRQKPVCHSSRYHKYKGHDTHGAKSKSTDRTTSSRSYCSLLPPRDETTKSCSESYNARELEDISSMNEKDISRTLLESRYIDEVRQSAKKVDKKISCHVKTGPCVCGICRRYHELFHRDSP